MVLSQCALGRTSRSTLAVSYDEAPIADPLNAALRGMPQLTTQYGWYERGREDEGEQEYRRATKSSCI